MQEFHNADLSRLNTKKRKITHAMRGCGEYRRNTYDAEKLAIILDSVYYTENSPNGGGRVNTRDIIRAAAKELDITLAELARRNGWIPQKLNDKLARGSIKSQELLDIMDVLGIEVVLRVKETGKEINVGEQGHGKRIRAMVDGVIYDTASSRILASSFYADGVNEYNNGTAVELYADRDGRYFFAEYSEWDGVKDRVCPVSSSVAADFIERHGLGVHKGKKQDNK